MNAEALLRVYDDELRTEAETPSALSVERLGPLHLVRFAGGRGFVTYRDLAGADETSIDRLVDGALEHYLADPAISRVEWKTRGHDRMPGLHEALLARGFHPDATEAVMMGSAHALASQDSVPNGISIRRIHAEDDVRAMCAMQDRAFGDAPSQEYADGVWARMQRRDGMELWVAEVGAEIVGSGRLEPVAGSRVAGLWGGATLSPWRGRGIYRALVCARALSALAMDRTILHSDSTPMSEPILARLGLTKVTTTTPYRWRRGA